MSKVVKRIAREDKSEHGTQIAILGEKAKSQIAREARKAITIHFSNVGKTIPTMSDAVSIWNTIRICSTTPKLESGDAEKSPATSKDEPNKQLMIVYNRFVSMISFETVIVPIDRGIGLIAEDPPVVIESKYEGVSGLYKDFAEYLTVSRLFCALVEGHVTELISKRGAMENATKNSEEMVATLTMKYNRTRQAVITNELVDIIVGASAL